MRPNCGVYIDAGYLLAALATRVTGTSLRNSISVDFPELLHSIISQAERVAGIRVLRVHWYDAAANGIPDAVQERIGLLPKVKLRLGRFGFDGQQKGVDLRMGLDLVAHARNKAVETIILVSGDDDLTEAVEEAQVHGVEVVLLAVPNALGHSHGVSRHLQRAADGLELIDPAALASATRRPASAHGDVALPSAPDSPALTGSPTLTLPPQVPTPATVAKMMRPQTGSLMVYSGTTGLSATVSPEYARTDEEIFGTIDTVVKNALVAFLDSASVQDLAALDLDRPSIPRDLDRALLLDLSDALSTYNLSDRLRTQLRRRFWEVADEHGKTKEG